MATVQETPAQREAQRLRDELDQAEQRADATAEQVRAHFRRQVDALDPDLTAEARKQRTDELREQAKAKMAAGRDDYDGRLADLAARARRAAFGSVPSATDGALLVAWRDAQDRADHLEHRDEAETAMSRALETGDTTMVKAIIRRAHSRGWAEVAMAGVDRELLIEVSRLEELTSPRGRGTSTRRMFRWSV